MFSTLSHFLPASLHPTSSKTSQIREDDDDDDPGNKSDKSDAHADEIGVHKKKKEKSANETFIFVRPPPAKSNHPLNLQVQLVPPNSRGPSGLTSASRQSLDISASAPYQSGVPLTRTASTRSTASSTYSATSTNTSASTTSTSSTASSRRMIVPLYNLQAHNVMTNIIVDAGTDAKIARFTKRGIEMLDLAVFEPVEVYAGGGPPDAIPLGGTSGFSTRGKNNANLTVPGANTNGGSRPGTPDPASSQASLTNSSLHSQHDLHHSAHSNHSNSSHSHEPAHAPGAATPQGKRKFLGNLFKKKDASSSAVGASPASDASLTPTPTPGRIFGHARTRSALAGQQPPSPSPRASFGSGHRSSVEVSVSGAHDEGLPPTPSTPTHPQSQPHAQTVVGRQPILGLLASVSSPVHPPKGRPGLYVWVAKRWLKDHFGGGLLKVAKGMVRGHGSEHDLTAEVEVRFEWKRGKGRRRRDKEKDRDASGENGGRVARRQASTSGLVTPQKRLSMGGISRQSSFSVTEEQQGEPEAKRRSLLHSGQPQQEEDSGDESDPEDSETPWTCTVKVRRLAAPHARPQHGGKKDKEVLRIKVATLSPTPHHPKVVAMLKVPFPLPDIDVERMVVHKRETGRGSLNADTGPKPGGLLLTAEEIKDVVCSTGLWLVVREGFGGIGKVNRKGDGWRLRG
ncbi:hypothetical protein C8R45DRAFT_911805 [Mycena sanguinolenta]|nr:hypothetical protein C8R45DRAFT_911805 [Mycena sanguinolenta]